jgi:hypothetical protein
MLIKKWRNYYADDWRIDIKRGAYLKSWTRKERTRSDIQRARVRFEQSVKEKVIQEVCIS